MKEPERKAIIQMAAFAGPLPPPALLDEYGKIDGSFPERIVAMAEREQRQRHDWENIEQIRANRESVVGLALATVWVVGCLGFGGWSLYNGLEWAGVAGLLAASVPVVVNVLRRPPLDRKR